MKAKTYIAILLVSIFLVKFLAIDGNGLRMLFGGTDITFVIPNCEKQNTIEQEKNTAHFSQVEFGTSQVIHLIDFCNSQFQLELFSWGTDSSETIAVYNEHFPSRLSYLYLDYVSPPPRLF